MKQKLNNFFNNIKRIIIFYFTTSKLFIAYFILSLIGTMLVRYFTVGSPFNLKPILVDIPLILIIGSIGYFIKDKKKYRYYMSWLIIFSIAEFANHIYYLFYNSFASFGELSGLNQAETVTGSIFDKVHPINFIYFLMPIIFYFIYKKISNTNEYYISTKLDNKRRKFFATIIIAIAFLTYSFSTATKTDYSRLAKQWNRGAIVDRFGIIMYELNDLVQTLTPKINSLFGYEDAAKIFKEFYSNEENKYDQKNKYTDVLKDYNIIFVHMESIQTFLMDLTFNGQEVTPTINELAKEGMFFNNFYPQVSSGTSSDSEFTLLTSLLPASSGIVFTSYYDRNYTTIPKLLIDKNYFTFSMHGNYASMWNREKVHPNLGYQKMYFRESFLVPDKDDKDFINLGISDHLFFEQAIPKLEEIEESNNKYMGTIITLSNHSPFNFLDKYGEFDMSTTVTDEDGNIKSVDYISETNIGKYIKSAHYADVSLGEFITSIKNSKDFNNTVFVFYGDHDARFSRNEINELYNMNYETGELYTIQDEEYYDYNSFEHDLNKKTPLIIWSKNKSIQNKIHKTVSYPMGMYDVMPTIGNMIGIKNEYALGHDIFNIKDNNIVIFPSGNFLTSNLYFNNSQQQYYVTKLGAAIDEDYIEECKKYAEKRIEVSNAIITYDLIYNEGDNLNKKENDNG